MLVPASVKSILPLLIRIAWLVIALLAARLFSASILAEFQTLQTVCDGSACLANGQLFSGEAHALRGVGLSPTTYAAASILMPALSALVSLAVAGVIFWRLPGNRVALFVSFFLILFGVLFNTDTAPLRAANPLWGGLAEGLKNAGILSLFVFLYLFPNGRFVPHWTLWFTIFLVSFLVILSLIFPAGETLVEALNLAVFFVPLLIGVGAQIYRYARVSTPAERQQTRWLVFSVAALALAGIGFGLLEAAFPVLTGPTALGVLFGLAQRSTMITLFMLVPLSIGIAILRYRLWDIDLIIRRTLVYALLTALLALTYFSSVVLLQGVVSNSFLTGDTPIVTVLSTLAVAALFTPLRRRIQNFIDHRFYRRNYDAEKILAAFGASLRDEVDLDRLTASLLVVVQETMQPELVSLWLRKTGSDSQAT
jgi:hypothetical protein